MSIKLRLLLLIATSLLTALIVSLVSYVGNTRMSGAVNDNAVSMTALRNHMEADMMHDALRADQRLGAEPHRARADDVGGDAGMLPAVRQLDGRRQADEAELRAVAGIGAGQFPARGNPERTRLRTRR